MQIKCAVMKKIVVFTGAGVSAESGLATFRDADGLWAQYRIEDVCTPEALARNRALVVEFYNKRRKELLATQPNAAHVAIARLEELFEVEVITQNVDDLHERAGSTKVLHLHGELKKLRSEKNPDLIVPIDGWEQKLDDRAPDGSLLRPHIVFFGESVPMYDPAVRVMQCAELVIVVGTSLAVYPAASLLRYAQSGVPIFVVDPGEPDCTALRNTLYHIKEKAGKGVPMLAEKLISQLKR
jgi:NAD-dependent deacetylase